MRIYDVVIPKIDTGGTYVMIEIKKVEKVFKESLGWNAARIIFFSKLHNGLSKS